MDPRLKALLDLPSKSVDELLDDLAALSEKRRSDPAAPVPTVTLHLASGRSLTGHVLRASDTRRSGKVVLFHDPGREPRSMAYDVIHLPASVIEAVTFHDQPVFAKPKPGVAPGRLELKRTLASFEEVIATHAKKSIPIEADWPLLAENEDDRLAIARLAEALQAALAQVMADEAGRAAVAGKLDKLVLSVGPRADASLTAGAFTVTVRSSYDIPDVAALRAALERGL